MEQNKNLKEALQLNHQAKGLMQKALKKQHAANMSLVEFFIDTLEPFYIIIKGTAAGKRLLAQLLLQTYSAEQISCLIIDWSSSNALDVIERHRHFPGVIFIIAEGDRNIPVPAYQTIIVNDGKCLCVGASNV